MQQTLRIGEVSKKSGLAPSAIRYYEESGIVPTPERTESGYRGYADDDVEILRFVGRLRTLEVPLSDVREIVALRREGKAPCTKVRSTIASESAAIQSRIDDLKRLQKELRSLEEKAKDLPDDWPTVCVCNVIEDSATGRGQS
jgi:DNA-binding transcriptional MerR regulator